MKTIVSMQDLRELEIKPADLLAEYRQRLAQEVRALWKNASVKLQKCPCCQAGKLEPVFEKWDVSYARCGRCHSIFAARRPDEQALNDFYRTSKAALFWREEVLQATENARREKLLLPRLEWILDGLAEHAPEAAVGLDYTPSHGGALEMLAAEMPGLESCIAAHPQLGPKPSHSKIIPSPGALYAQPAPKVDFLIALDAFDRAAEPPAFVAALERCLSPGGVAFLTATSASGFDVQMLAERSPSVLPPDRLNLASIEGFRALFAAPRWEICELSTPGVLDVDIVKRELEAMPKTECSPFIHYVLKERGEDCHASLQEFLQANLLSSFARLIVRKK